MSVREQPTKVKMAIGIDNFREMREKQNYYVDKDEADHGGGIRGWNMYAAGAEQGSDARIPGTDRSLHRGSGGEHGADVPQADGEGSGSLCRRI